MVLKRPKILFSTLLFNTKRVKNLSLSQNDSDIWDWIIMPVRKIPKNYRNITGMAAHSKSVGCAAYESSLERDFLSLLEFCPDVIRFEVQPVSIEWFDDSGKKHMYTPDVLVHYKPSRQPVTIILYEVKYRSDLRNNWSVLQPKFKAARAFCRQKG